MIDSIFVEREVLDHPIAQKVIKRLKHADVFEIERYPVSYTHLTLPTNREV